MLSAGSGALAGAAGGALVGPLGGELSSSFLGDVLPDIAVRGLAGAAAGAAGGAIGGALDPGLTRQPSRASLSCGGESFTAATKVLTASGALVAISKLKPGQKVKATDTKTGKTTAQAVAAVLVHYDKDLYDLRVQVGGRSTVIKTTSSHLFWDATARRWVKAAALKYGHHLRTSSGGTAIVAGGYIPRHSTGWMWDLTVPGNHDFYIQAADTTILVHNETDPEQCPLFPDPERDEFGKPGGHTAARVGESRVVSGGSPAPMGYADVNVQEVLTFQEQIGFPARRAGAQDFDGPGSYYASHAERKAYVLSAQILRYQCQKQCVITVRNFSSTWQIIQESPNMSRTRKA